MTLPPQGTTISHCLASCNVCVYDGATYNWVEVTPTTTILAGTVVEIINTGDGTTRTSTILDPIPTGYTVPQTDTAGTRITEITYSRDGSVFSTVM
jgi:hypothetical protein